MIQMVVAILKIGVEKKKMVEVEIYDLKTNKKRNLLHSLWLCKPNFG